MKKLFFLLLVVWVGTLHTAAQETREKIKDYCNVEVLLDNGWAGESLTLIKENKDYFILRKVFGSGVSVAGTIKYAVTFNSDFQIDFSEIIEIDTSKFKKPGEEVFRMRVLENGVAVYLNGLKIVTAIKKLPEKP